MYAPFLSCSLLNMALKRFTKSLNFPAAHIFKSLLMYLAHEFLFRVLCWFGLFGPAVRCWGLLRCTMLCLMNNELEEMLKGTAVA
jgi:cellobiose-specific phosphotransferase system component IIC